MKKFTLVLFAILISFGFILTGCSGTTLTIPQNYLDVSSNGGFVVEVGDYMYFANAYQSYTKLKTKSDNDGNGVKQFSLKRAKIENNSFKLNEDDNVAFENVVNKIAAFETSNMFVVNEYLYFTSPNVHKNDSKDKEEYNTYQFELSTLFRIKLDGSGLKEIYTTETSTAQFYLTGGGEQKLLIYDDNKILQVNCFQNSTNVSTMAEKVTSAIFPYQQNQEIVDVYYTVDREEGDPFTGNILKKLNVVTGESFEVAGYSNNKETITLISYDGDRLFYTRTGGNGVDKLYSNDFSNGQSSEQSQRYDTDNFKSGSKIYLIKDSQYNVNAFVFEYNGNIFLQDMADDNGSSCDKLTNESSKIAFVDGTYVYYTTENGIFRVSVLGSHIIQQISDVKDFNADLLDFDGRFVYFYAKAEGAETDTKYLYKADTYACDADNIITECLAQLLEQDEKQEEISE